MRAQKKSCFLIARKNNFGNVKKELFFYEGMAHKEFTGRVA
jgi:hypothetical protein